MIPTAVRPWSSADLRIVNSLMNVPKGGVPVIAKNPASQSAPETGSTRASPRTPAVDLVRVAAKMLPATKNSIALVSEWFTAWSSAPNVAAPPRPIPSARIPMCSTLE